MIGPATTAVKIKKIKEVFKKELLYFPLLTISKVTIKSFAFSKFFPKKMAFFD